MDESILGIAAAGLCPPAGRLVPPATRLEGTVPPTGLAGEGSVGVAEVVDRGHLQGRMTGWPPREAPTGASGDELMATYAVALGPLGAGPVGLHPGPTLVNPGVFSSQKHGLLTSHLSREWQSCDTVLRGFPGAKPQPHECPLTGGARVGSQGFTSLWGSKRDFWGGDLCAG